MLDLPERVSGITYKDGVLIINNSKQIKVAKFSIEDMQQIAHISTLKGFYFEDYPVTDEMIFQLIGLKNMVNFGVINGNLTDNCFEYFATMTKLKYLWLQKNKEITGHKLSCLNKSKLDSLDVSDTAFDNDGLKLAAQISKLSTIKINNTKVTIDGLMSIANNNKIRVYANELFAESQLAEFVSEQRNQSKNKTSINKQQVKEATITLMEFFEFMTNWESKIEKQGMHSDGIESQLNDIFIKYVSEKPRMGYRPRALSCDPNSTYSGHNIIDAEQITKNKLHLYTKDAQGIEANYRFLMRYFAGQWKIDYVQIHSDGWKRIGL